MVFGAIGIVLGIITVLIRCKMENKKLPKMSGKNVLRTVYAIVAALVFGIGMCLVWEQIIWGTFIGLLGIVMLIAPIPMIKGIKQITYNALSGCTDNLHRR